MSSRSNDATAVVWHRLQPPRLPRVHLPRPSLVRRVLDLQPGGVCVLGAPAGYGCSVLLAEVAGATEDRVAWVSAPRQDRATVWHHVLAALAEAGVDAGVAAVHLDDGVQGAFLTALLNALAGAAGPVILVLDNLDGIVHAPVLDDLEVLADSLPPTTRLVVRLEHGGLMLRRGTTSSLAVRLGVQDLALDRDQAGQLLVRLAPDLSPDRADAVIGLADGWPAALCAPFAPGSRDPDQDPAAWLIEVGVESVAPMMLEALPDDDRDLVVSTSVVDVVTPALAAHLAGCGGAVAAEALDRLRRWGVLRGSTETRGGCTLHPLVREYARRQVALRGPVEVARLHRVAAEWLAAAGDTTTAIDQALDAGDLPWALTMMEQSVGPLLDSGRADQVHRLYARTPETVLVERHLHLLAAAWAGLLSGNVPEAHRRIEQLKDAVDSLQDRAGGVALVAAPPGVGGEEGYAHWLRGEALLLRSYFAWWRGRPEHSRRLAGEAHRIFGTRWTRTAHQVAAVHLVRPVVWLADTQDAHTALLTLAARPGLREPYRRVTLPGLQAVLAVRQGRVRRALSIAQSAVWAARTYGSPAPFTTADARLALSMAKIDVGEPAAALSQAAELAEDAGESGHDTYLCLARVAQARALGRLGRRNEAMDLLALARERLAADGGERGLLRLVDDAEARVRLEAGDRAGARLLLRRLEPGPGTDLLAARLAPLGSPEMLRWLRSFRPRNARQEVEAQLLMATAYARLRPAEAQPCLLRASTIAVEAGLLTAMVGVPDEVQVLATRLATSSGGESLRVLVSHARASGVAEQRVSHPTARLSTGERRLLEAMAQGAGQRALAATLGVSVNTVKTRLSRLYRKLGVSDREAALAVARAEGLLPPSNAPAPAPTRADGRVGAPSARSGS